MNKRVANQPQTFAWALGKWAMNIDAHFSISHARGPRKNIPFMKIVLSKVIYSSIVFRRIVKSVLYPGKKE